MNQNQNFLLKVIYLYKKIYGLLIIHHLPTPRETKENLKKLIKFVFHFFN